MAFLRVAAVSSRVRVNFSAVESKVFCKNLSAQPISRSLHLSKKLEKYWVKIKEALYMEFNGFLPSIDHFCHLILSGKAFWWFAFLPETCSLYQISSGKGRQWSFCQDLMKSFYSMWNLGEKNKGVDAGAVGLVHWDRDVQEAVSPPHLDKTLSRNEILKLLAGDCLHAPTWMLLHLDTLHLQLANSSRAIN